MKKIFFFGDPKNTLWDETQCQMPFERSRSKFQADIWVSTQEFTLMTQIEHYMVMNGKKPKLCILWTHEPYFSTRTESSHHVYHVPTYFFTIWNHKALFHNGTFLFQKFPSVFPEKPSPRTSWRSQGKRTVALITYPQSTVPETKERAIIAKHGHTSSVLDIYGKGWPDGISKGNSRDGEWWNSKPGILAGYDFNLAMENCCQPYYVSEKLWDSILYGCLPIYKDNGTIYETFPKDSFLDIKNYSSYDELWKHVESMSLEEWNRRYFACWEAMETLWKTYAADKDTLWRQSKDSVLDTIHKFEFK